MAFARSTVPIRVREESWEFGLKACQLLQAVFEHGKLVEVAVHGRDKVDQAQGGKGSALPDREHQAGHDNRGGAVRTTAGHRCAGAAPLRWHLATERRIEASDHALRQDLSFGGVSTSSARAYASLGSMAYFHKRLADARKSSRRA